MTVASMMGLSPDLLNCGWVGKLSRVIDLRHAAIGSGDAVADAGGGGDEIDIELALQAFP